MNLELKHLAAYLPYGLNICRHNNKKYILELIGLDKDYLKMIDIKHRDMTSLKSRWSDVSENKPILRPLSDLVKEINYNGEKIVPIEELLKMVFPKYYKENKDNRYGKIKSEYTPVRVKSYFQNHAIKDIELYIKFQWNFPTWITNELCKWHFDVFDLIEKGLAIDINKI